MIDKSLVCLSFRYNETNTKIFILILCYIFDIKEVEIVMKKF